MSRFVPKDGLPQGPHAGDEPASGELSLLSLPGVGRSKAQALINAGYHSLRQVADTPLDELQKVPGLGPKTAREVRRGALQALSENEPERSRPTVVPHPRSAEVAADPEPAPEPETKPGLSLSDFFGSDGGSSELKIATGGDIGETDSAHGTDAAELRAIEDEAEPSHDGEADPEVVETTPDDAAPGSYEHAKLEDGVALGGTPSAEEAGAPDSKSGTTELLDVHLSVHIANSLLMDFDRDLAREFEVIPVQRMGDEILVASENDLDEAQLEELSERAGIKVHAIPSQVASLDATLRTLYDDNTFARVHCLRTTRPR